MPPHWRSQDCAKGGIVIRQLVGASALLARPRSVDTLGGTAGVSSSAGNTVGQANRGTRQFSSVGALGGYTRRCKRSTALGWVVLGLWSIAAMAGPLRAQSPLGGHPDPFRANTSPAARDSAVRSIPVEKMDAAARAKVASVLSNVTIFRRMPIGVIDCDPNLYLFLVRHPDVVVNIWEVLKLSEVKLRQAGEKTYQISDPAGTLASVQFLYSAHDLHIIYGEGSYEGPLSTRPIKGRCLMVLKTGYVRETNGRYYVTTRLDTFIRVEPIGAELLTKAIHPLMGKTADANFTESLSFLGSLSRTAEVNSPGVQRLAGKLTDVAPESRLQLAQLAADITRKSHSYSSSQPKSDSSGEASDATRVAGRTDSASAEK